MTEGLDLRLGVDKPAGFGWARGASNEYARKELNWAPAWPSWREGFAAL